MYKKILSVVLLVYGVFGTGWLDLLDVNFPKPKPAPAKILNVDTPSEDVQKRVQIFSELVTNPDDKAKLAIFNYEFSQRITEYKTNAQNVNDVYTIAGKTFFQQSLVNKYEGLNEEIVSLLTECMTDENHVLTQDEKNNLHEYFMGVAWVLIQRG